MLMKTITFFFNEDIYESRFLSFQEDALPETNVIVAVKQRNLLATAFHPELTADTRWYLL